MKITTDKQQPVKLYDWLKAKQITLKELILKKNFKSYSDLINFFDRIIFRLNYKSLQYFVFC